ncbi:hypothetical protein ABK040_003831 [Willaertia magna]
MYDFNQDFFNNNVNNNNMNNNNVNNKMDSTNKEMTCCKVLNFNNNNNYGIVNTMYFTKHRPKIIDWFFSIQAQHQLLQSTIHSSLFLLDQCYFKILKLKINFNIKTQLQLLSICCLWIVIKNNEVFGEKKLTLQQIDEYCCNSYTKDQIREMELFILHDLLQWKLQNVNASEFLEFFYFNYFNLQNLNVLNDSYFILDCFLLYPFTLQQFQFILEIFKNNEHQSNVIDDNYFNLLALNYLNLLNFPRLLSICSLLTSYFLFYENLQDQGQPILLQQQQQQIIYNNSQPQSQQQIEERFYEIISSIYEELNLNILLNDLFSDNGQNFNGIIFPCCKLLYSALKRYLFENQEIQETQ